MGMDRRILLKSRVGTRGVLKHLISTHPYDL